MLTNKEYIVHCAKQERKQGGWLAVCLPVRNIRGLSARELLQKYGSGDTLRTDLTALLRNIGISALPKDFSEWENLLQRDNIGSRVRILGAVVKNNDNAVIYYSADDEKSSHRCRFTIAHELAHCCLAHDINNIYIDLRTEGENSNEEEMAANVFAGELLIPKKALEIAISRLLLPSVKSLADIFDVSTNVMLARLKYLNVQDKVLEYNY